MLTGLRVIEGTAQDGLKIRKDARRESRDRQTERMRRVVTRDVSAKLGERGQCEERRMGGKRGDIVTDRIEQNDRGTRWGTFYRGDTELK